MRGNRKEATVVHSLGEQMFPRRARTRARKQKKKKESRSERMKRLILGDTHAPPKTQYNADRRFPQQSGGDGGGSGVVRSHH